MAWQTGRPILYRDVLTPSSVADEVRRVWRRRRPLQGDVGAGKVTFARPVTVVHDRHGEVALYQACGAPVAALDFMWANTVANPWVGTGANFEWLGPLMGEWPHRFRTWVDTNVLMLTPPGAWHSVWLMWEAQTWKFRCWYVNLQMPLVSTSRGFDTLDRMLDVVIAPNGDHRWKDEDHLERALDIGWISAEDARRVRSEGERVIERAARREYPFDGELISWRPDPAWPIPTLPPDWSVVDHPSTG